MTGIKLQIPRQQPAHTASIDTHPKQVQAWIASLPMANVNETAGHVLRVLKEFNRMPMASADRHHIMGLIQPVVDHVVKAIKKRYLTATFPLSEKIGKNVDVVRSLLAETAFGYKIIVVELVPTGGQEEIEEIMLLDSIRHTIRHLANILLETYLVYTLDSKGIWAELHQLYRYVEKNAGYMGKTRYIADQDDLQTEIINAYKRILLLALGNPYQFMQGEANRVYQYLEDWAPKCRIIRPGAKDSLSSKFIIDLAIDAAPRYVTAKMKSAQPIEARILEVSDVLDEVRNCLSALAAPSKSTGTTIQTTLGKRMRRDMLVRLESAWSMRSERLSTRTTQLSKVIMASGLSACHHFVSGEVPFTPEKHEIEIRKAQLAAKGVSNMELVPHDAEHWQSEDMAKRLATGIVKPRTSHFDTGAGEDHKDMWIKVYATEARRLVEDEQKRSAAEPTYAIHLWHQKNDNSGGRGLVCNYGQHIQVNVGELVAYKPIDTAEHTEWAIGLIRWLRIQQESAVHIGIKSLSEDSLAVSTKGIKGVGAGCEYFRCLLVPNLDPLEHPTTLLVPAAIYDVGSILVMGLKDKLIYVRLTRLVQATKSFSQFQFEVSTAPITEMERALSLKAERILR